MFSADISMTSEFLVQLAMTGVALFSFASVLVAQCGSKRKSPVKKPRVAGANGSLSSVSRSSKRKPKRGSKRGSKRSSRRSAKKSSASKSSKGSKSSKRGSRRSDKSKKKQKSAKAAVPTQQAVPHARLAQQQKGSALDQHGDRSSSASRKVYNKQEISQKIRSEVHIEPRELRFTSQGGVLSVTVHNPTRERRAIKIKTSDNNLYRVNPVYSFVEPNSALNIHVARDKGDSKIDKLIFVIAKPLPNATNPKAVFSTTTVRHPMIVMPLLS